MTKEEYRLKYKNLRSKISLETLEELSVQIANNALQLPIWDYTNYHLFLSIKNIKTYALKFLLKPWKN